MGTRGEKQVLFLIVSARNTLSATWNWSELIETCTFGCETVALGEVAGEGAPVFWPYIPEIKLPLQGAGVG